MNPINSTYTKPLYLQAPSANGGGMNVNITPHQRPTAFTTPVTPQGTWERLHQALTVMTSAISAFGTYASAQRSADKAAGVPVWQGALAAGAQVLNGAQGLFNASRTTHDDSLASLLSQLTQLDSTGLSTIASYGQQAILGNFARETTALLAKELGMDTSKLALEGISSVFSGSSGASATTGAMTGTGATASTTTGSGLASMGGKALGFVGAAYSGYELLKNWGNSTPAQGAVQGGTAGAYIGSCIAPGIGTVIGGAIGAIAGGLIGCIKSGKHKDQKARDNLREGLQKLGFVDEKWCVRLADGTGYDIGKDGGFKLQNIDGTKRHAYDVDLKDPLSVQVSSTILPIAREICGGNEKLAGDLTGYLTNAALSNTRTFEGAQANLQAMFGQIRR